MQSEKEFNRLLSERDAMWDKKFLEQDVMWDKRLSEQNALIAQLQAQIASLQAAR